MERRTVLSLGAGALAGIGLSSAHAAPQQRQPFGRSVTDFGVVPDTGQDQTRALQKAIDEIAASGQPILIPPGTYTVAGLELPTGRPVHIQGAGALSRLRHASQKGFIFTRGAAPGQALSLSQLSFIADFEQGAAAYGALQLQDGAASVHHVEIILHSGTGIAASSATLDLSDLRISGRGGKGTGIDAKSSTVRLFRSQLAQCDIGVRTTENSVAQIHDNVFVSCATHGASIASGTIQGNQFAGAGREARIALRAGGSNRLGSLLVTNNMIESAQIGIGVSNAPDGYALISLNMITGARDGAIRALDGDRPVGPDLARSSAESFRNLAIAGNVAL
jgi:hypothetical protein